MGIGQQAFDICYDNPDVGSAITQQVCITQVGMIWIIDLLVYILVALLLIAGVQMFPLFKSQGKKKNQD